MGNSAGPDRGRALDKLLSGVAAMAASTTIDNVDEVLEETLRMATECFGALSAGIWATGEQHQTQVITRWADGRLSRDPTMVPIAADEQAAIMARGFGFVRPADVGAEPPAEDARALVVPIGPGPAGFLVHVATDRRWSDDEIDACRALADIADRTRFRIRDDMLMRSRLREEAFSARVASKSMDVELGNGDDRVDEILRLSLEHYGVAEAAVWHYDGSELTCRVSVRNDGPGVAAGSSIAVTDLGRLESRGWAVVRLADLDLGEITRVDHDGSRVLLTSFWAGDGVDGLLVLTDPTGRWWNDESLASSRTVAATLGHIRSRMEVARRLRQQREVDEILSNASREFVDTTLDDVLVVVTRALEKLRHRFGLAGLSLFALDQRTMQVECTCEATADGRNQLGRFFPIPRDHPAIARILDPRLPDECGLGELFGFEGLDDRAAMVFPAVRGRDLLILVATRNPRGRFEGDARSALNSMTGLLAQLRHRLLLEVHSRRRASADQLVADIARSFVEQPPYDHEVAVAAALRRIGEFFGLRAIGRWSSAGSETVTRESWWSDADLDPIGLETLASVDIESPLAQAIAAAGPSAAMELGALAPFPELSSDTLALQQVTTEGEPSGLIAALSPRPPHLVVDLDIQRDVLARVSRLMEQLFRRAAADRAVARQLRHEDLLRRFATSLVNADADAHETIARSFRHLADAVGVDEATIWHFHPTDDGFEVGALGLVGEHDGEQREAHLAFRLPQGATGPALGAVHADGVGGWDLDAAPEGVQAMVRQSLPDGPRQVAFLPAPGSDLRDEASFLSLSRPGDDGFTTEELEFFRSAHSILTQHDARITAERWFSAAFNSAPVGITLRKADMTLLHCNAAFAELVGRPVEQLRGSTLHDVMPADMADLRAAAFEKGSDDMFEVESAYRRPDGTIRWASVRSSPVRLPGRHEPLLLNYVEDITDRRRNREMLEYQATHDELTGLSNRRALDAEIGAELERSGDCAVLVLDLDRFKVVNDSLGHSVGDQLLITCADRIRLSLRPGDSVCRLGGDEFAILLRSPADPHAAGVVAERLLRLVREPVVIGDDEVYPSASIGVAVPEPGDTVGDLLRHADAAMYQAKGQGRDRWEAFDGSMRQAVVDRVRTETDLRRSIENGQLEVHYQPEFLLETGEIVGTEALVRWRHPERGLLSAGSFIGLAEESGVVVDIGRLVLAQATQQGARWLADGHDVITRVNLSARQLRGAVEAEVEGALAAADLPADRLCLELTETAIMDDVQESARILARFRELGVQVAVDDFGTGFSSLAYLKRFPVDILKVDQTFVDGVGIDPDDTAIVRSVISLARTLRLEVVAEGIETATQLAELVRLGCGRGQGFHLAGPAPADDISRLLVANRAKIEESGLD